MRINWNAARKRIEALAEHSIELPAAVIPVAPAHRPTLIERLQSTFNETQLAELCHLTLEECK